MLALLEECLRLHRRTGGIFNPLVIESLEAAGYDMSFEQLAARGPIQMSPGVVAPSLECLDLHAGRQAATLPLGLRLDLGGFGKGYAVDHAVALLPAGANFLIDGGGDIYAAGFAPQGGPWRVDVVHPIAPDEVICNVALSDGGIATSWATKRRWRVTGGWAHHLIDPRTGRPAESGVIGATVIAPTTVEADVFAKCALILGPKDGPAFLDTQGVHGLLVLADGSIQRTAYWPAN
jgi:thiamine biosynthesis lipoprotein